MTTAFLIIDARFGTHTCLIGLLPAIPTPSSRSPSAPMSAGVKGDGRPFSLFFPLFASATRSAGLEGCSGALLLGAGVKLASTTLEMGEGLDRIAGAFEKKLLIDL